MGQQVVSGAMLACTFGVAPAPLVATSAPTVAVGGVPAATIMDFVPMENIPTFAMCMSLANPEVASATSAALGVLTPQPCIPVTTGPWAPGSPTVLVGGSPALTADSMCMCMWAGQISITDPGQVSVSVEG
jgi:uncharacterized Zn-binding protein involved in type VI secretion